MYVSDDSSTPTAACPPHRIGLDIRHDAGKGSSIRTSMVLNDNSNSFCCAGISLLDTKTSATASMQNVGGLVTLKKGDKVTIGKKHWAGGITISDWSVFRHVCKCYPWQQTSTTKRLRLPFVLFLNLPKSLNSTDKDWTHLYFILFREEGVASFLLLFLKDSSVLPFFGG